MGNEHRVVRNMLFHVFGNHSSLDSLINVLEWDYPLEFNNTGIIIIN